MLLVQQYLLTKTLNDLSREHGIYARIHNHKFSLNYDQIEAVEHDKMAQQCRGLILSHVHPVLDLDTVVGQTEIQAYPFNRFFNFGQGSAANIDYDAPGVQFFEKLDGTCIILYHDNISDKWCVATRAVPEADIIIDGFGQHTFSTLFKETVLKVTSLNFEDWVKAACLVKDMTYIFELTTPLNKIVVQYKDYNIHLLGLRNKKTYKEEDIKTASNVLVPLCPTYRLNNVVDLMKFVSSRNALEHEGVVVCDSKFARNKIKNPEYMAFSRIKDSVANSPRAIMQIVLAGKLDDLFAILPDHLKPTATKFEKGLQKLIKDFHIELVSCMAELKLLGVMSDKVSQKQFALIVQRKNVWLAPAMMIYSGKISTLQGFLETQKALDGNYKKTLLENLIDKVEGYKEV